MAAPGCPRGAAIGRREQPLRRRREQMIAVRRIDGDAAEPVAVRSRPAAGTPRLFHRRSSAACLDAEHSSGLPSKVESPAPVPVYTIAVLVGSNATAPMARDGASSVRGCQARPSSRRFPHTPPPGGSDQTGAGDCPDSHPHRGDSRPGDRGTTPRALSIRSWPRSAHKTDPWAARPAAPAWPRRPGSPRPPVGGQQRGASLEFGHASAGRAAWRRFGRVLRLFDRPCGPSGPRVAAGKSAKRALTSPPGTRVRVLFGPSRSAPCATARPFGRRGAAGCCYFSDLLHRFFVFCGARVVSRAGHGPPGARLSPLCECALARGGFAAWNGFRLGSGLALWFRGVFIAFAPSDTKRRHSGRTT